MLNLTSYSPFQFDITVWLIIGVALLCIEMLTGTFHFLFFGLAAFLVALLSWLFIDSLTLQISIFSLLSLMMVFVLKKKILFGSLGFQNDISQNLIMSSSISKHSEGFLNYQGTMWTAVNTSNSDLNAGDLAQIIKTEGNKILLKPISKQEN